MSDKLNQILAEYSLAEEFLQKVRDSSDFPWEQKEKVLSGNLSSKNEKSFKSKVNSNSLVNLVLDQSARIMAQMPSGMVRAITEKDATKSKLMQIVLEKYILQHANTQWDMLTKFRMVEMYSLVYGSMPCLVTYKVKPDYVGPDIELIHPRNFRLQANKYSVEDADYAFVNTIVPISFLQDIIKRKETVYDKKAVLELIERVKENRASIDEEDKTYEQKKSATSYDKNQVVLTTKYGKDNWVIFSRQFNIVIRDSKNPNDDYELPIVMKYTYPVLDKVYGLSLFDRGKSTAFALDSLTNMTLDSMMMSIRPPIVYNPNGVVPASLKVGAGVFWKEVIPNSIRQLPVTPVPTNVFQQMSQVLKSNLLNMSATTDTTVSRGDNVEMGKTPEAIKAQLERQGARDSWDRNMMENFVERVYSKMINMLCTKQAEPIDIELFDEDIKKLQEENIFEGLAVFESGMAGKLTVKPEDIREDEEKNVIKYKYFIERGSSIRKDEMSQNESLLSIINAYAGNPIVEMSMRESGKKLRMDKIYRKFVQTSGIENPDEFFEDVDKREEGQAMPTDMNPADMQMGEPKL